MADVLIASRQAFLRYAPIAHPPADVLSWVRDVLLNTAQVTVACTADGTVTGVLATRDADGARWIDQLYVAPNHVGQGIGSLLLEHALQHLERPVRLHTFQANDGARRFYERHGFVAIAFTDGSVNEERCPDVLYELSGNGPT